LVFSVGATQVNVTAPLIAVAVVVDVAVSVGVVEVADAGVTAVLALSVESSQPASMVERASNAASAGNFTIGAILRMRFPR
jgi:hypothetical protein